jgi:exosome complex RNA-binding protein Rrp42 (RNase PH superfamily)
MFNAKKSHHYSSELYAAVSAEVVEPWPDRLTEEFFNFNVEFSPMPNSTWRYAKRERREVEGRKRGRK